MPFDCTYTDNPWANYSAFGSITYILNPNTFVEARAGFLEVSALLTLPDPSQSGLDLNDVPITATGIRAIGSARATGRTNGSGVRRPRLRST